MRTPRLPDVPRGWTVDRVYVTCLDCERTELYDDASLREGIRVALRHRRTTGHRAHVEVTQSAMYDHPKARSRVQYAPDAKKD